MATKHEYRSSTAGAEREHHRASPWHQAMRFLGLFLSPLVGVLAAWLIHLWIGGIHLHSDRGTLDQGGHALLWLILTLVFILGSTGLITWLAWEFAGHRKLALRSSLAGSVALVGLFFGLNVAIGPNWRAAGCFLIVAWAVAVVWSIARLDVTRNDKQSEGREDTFLEKVGLKDWMSRKVTHDVDEHGDPLSTTVHFQHAAGDTAEKLSEAVPAFESVSASPSGLSYSTPTDRADRSSVTVMHQDPLARGIPIPDLPYEGGSIIQPLLVGKYANGQWVWAKLAGDPDGKNAHSPTSYLQMGMNRTGKTQSAESVTLTDVISRRDVVIFYANKAKGVQDVRCLIPGVEAAVIADDTSGTGMYREAIRQIKRMMTYRQRVLGEFGIHEWNPEQCWDNPRWRTDASGQRVQMERMPFLICHFAEADALLEEDRGDATYIVSKGLSLGVATGWSLQRADATKMPTGLRYNLGTSWCFGVGDSDSATMALSDWVVKAGAHPERWGQRKPGYFYFEGLGIDESLFVVPARGFAEGPNGTRLRDELLARNMRNGPRMAKLDRGSAMATGVPGEQSWWDQIVQSTDELRDRLLRTDEPQTDPQPAPQMAPQPVPDDEPQTDDEDDAEMRREMEEEMRETTEVEGVELYPKEGGARFEDADAVVAPARPEDHLSWDDPKPGARDRAAALTELARVLRVLMDREDLRDPADPSGNTVIVSATLLYETAQFRSRPWYSDALIQMANGRLPAGDCPTDLILTAAPDLGMSAGKYRLQRPTSGHIE